ncbi:hypothetical protein BGX30_004381 [Mortierella sp. GBA39]|nr:hypothetical protein BGX30_004381 [Mortierella sp. GBA39]
MPPWLPKAVTQTPQAQSLPSSALGYTTSQIHRFEELPGSGNLGCDDRWDSPPNGQELCEEGVMGGLPEQQVESVNFDRVRDIIPDIIALALL